MRRACSRLTTLPLGGFALALLGLALGAGSVPVAAQEMPVPVEVQVPLLLKILTFDRALTEVADPLVVGIVFQRRNRASAAVVEEVRVRLTAAARPVRVVVIDLDETNDLRVALLRGGVQVLYVAPLQAVSVSAITAATRREGADFSAHLLKLVRLTGPKDPRAPRWRIRWRAVAVDPVSPYYL